MIQFASVPRPISMSARAGAWAMRYSGVPSTYLLAVTVAIIAALALLPGNGCAGIDAVITGVRSALRSQWRHAYLNCTCCITDAFTSICNCSLTSSPRVKCVRAAWADLLIFGQVVFDALAWQVRRQQ
jgi:hypothetical protein